MVTTARSLYAATEPRHLLRPGEQVAGTVERPGVMTEWVLVREVRRGPSKRRHNGRLRKRDAH